MIQRTKVYQWSRMIMNNIMMWIKRSVKVLKPSRMSLFIVIEKQAIGMSLEKIKSNQMVIKRRWSPI